MNKCLRLLMLFIFCMPPLYAEKFIIAGDEWCPYNCSEKNGHEGYTVDIVKAVFQKEGMEVEYRLLPWARAIRELENGVTHAIIGASKTDERLAKGYVYPKQTIGVAQNIFLVAKGDPWHYQGIPSLRSISLGVLRDYSYGEVLDSYIQTNVENPLLIQMVAGTNALIQNFKKLGMGRLDAIVEDRAVANYVLKLNGLGGNFEEAGTLKSDPLYVAFSPTYPKARAMAEKLDQGLKRLRQSAQLKRILQPYGLKDWQK